MLYPSSQQFLRSLWGTFWILCSTGLVVVAVLVILLRLSLPALPFYKQEIRDWLQAETGVPIEFEGVTAQLDGRFLQIEVVGVSLQKEGGGSAQVTLAGGSLKIDLLHSLSAGELISTGILLRNPSIAFEHQFQSILAMAQINTAEEGNMPVLLSWLLRQPSVVVENATLQLLQEQREGSESGLQWKLADIHFDWINSGYRHQATGTLVLDGENPSPVTLKLEWFGDLLSENGWDGLMYLEAPSTHLVTLIGGEANQMKGLAQGTGHIEFWGEWLSGKLEKGRASLRRDEAFKDEPGLKVGEFHWKREGEVAWRLQMEKLAWGGESDKQSHPTSALVKYLQDKTGQELILGAVDRIRLVPSPALSGLYATVMHGESGALVSGDLHDVKFRSYPNKESLFNQIESKMVLSNISVQGVKQAAGLGVAGVNGKLHLNEQEGFFMPANQPIFASLQHYYPDPQQLTLEQGLVSWRRRSRALLLSFRGIEGEIGALRLQGGGQLLLPGGGQSPFLDVNAHIQVQRIADLIQQLPERQLRPELVGWLNESLLSGKLIDGKIKLKGALNQFPFEQGEGLFQADLQVQDLYLKYADEWPTVTHSQAEIHFNNGAMRAKLKEGKLDGHPIHNISIHSDKIVDGPFEVHGQLVSESPKLLRTLENTPLSAQARQLNSVVTMSGYALLELDVVIPVDESPLQVDGRVELHDNQLNVAALDLQIDQLKGNVEFNHDGVMIEGVQGVMLGGPVLITAFTSETEQQPEVVIGLEGALQGAALEHWFGLAEMKAPLFQSESKTEWSGRLKIQREDIDIHLYSELQGVQLNTPEPFNKSAEARWPATLSMKVRSGEVESMQVSMPEHLHATLYKGKAAAPWKGRLFFGDREQTLPAGELRDGLELIGALEEIDLGAWYDLSVLMRQEGAVNHGLNSVRFGHLLLTADRASLFGQKLDQLVLKVERRERQSIHVELSSEQIEGSILVPHDSAEKWVVDLSHLQLGEEVSGMEEDSAVVVQSQRVEFDPSKMPAMDLSSQKTVINGIDFGTLALQAHSTKSGLFFDDVVLKSDVMNVSAQGSWLQREGKPISKFNINLYGDQLGSILSLFGYGGDIDRGKSSIHVKAEWPDRPTEFSLSTMEGELELSVEKGQLKDVDQGIGRVFGLLGIHTLVRRLTLDFSDLTDQGFPFDTIYGTFSLLDGNAHTRNLVLDGPAAKIKVEGRTGIVAQDYDQIVAVSPKISETLPATGALLAGPAGAVVGSVVLLYQKLFSEDEIALTRYTLTGQWDDPQLEEIRKVSAPVFEPEYP
mgnify:FL=1